ncbi:MAG: DUF1501 domain-containing protein [Planctomycetaceae bacterium]|nr:DUF1501 domain-containing protein [Planctomycetaceae bacterium]
MNASRFTAASRRHWLAQASGLYLGGWASSSATPAATAASPRAKTVLFVVANGGQSQLETWDPKPLAPREVRGDFSTISTSVPGTQFSEHLPRLAQRAHQFAVIRSMSHEDLDHGSALYLTLTGQYYARRSSNPLPAATDWPTMGAVVKRVRPTQDSLETAVHLNGPAQIPINIGAGQNAGFLGPDFDPMLLGDITAEATILPGLSPLPLLDVARRNERARLLQQMERADRHASTETQRQQTLYDRAFDLLDRPSVQHAFNLDREPAALRDRYGRNRSGQACLLARRLVEAGVPWITLFWNHTGRGQDLAPYDTEEYGWDTHNDIFDALKNRLLPRFDQSFSTLLDDLYGRGLMDSTLVVCAGEFGRAPLVALEKNFAGESPGRKHWASCYSIIAAGAGVKPGQIIGASDRRGAYPATESWGPWDLTATMFHALGLDPESHFTDKSGRPFPLTSGRVIAPLYG